MMDYPQRIASLTKTASDQVAAAVELFDEGNTIPFIARYRKEITHGLDEEQLRSIKAALENLRSLDDRRQTILKTIRDQNALTPELEEKILSAETRTELEDLYLPYKPKRRTRASIARELGLNDLAKKIQRQIQTDRSLDDIAKPFHNENVPSIEDAFAGARDIVAENISDHFEVRRGLREKALKFSYLKSEKIQAEEDPRQVFKDYYDFSMRVDRLRPHQVLAINRGEREKILRVKTEISQRDWRWAIGLVFAPDPRSPLAGQLQLAIEDAAKRLLLPSIERFVRRKLSESAESHAIEVFAENLRALLTQPPLYGYTIMGIDPGYRTGCKVAVVDPTSKVLDTAAIYPHPPKNQIREAMEQLTSLVKRLEVNLIAIGNGTASRETEMLIAELIRSAKTDSSDSRLSKLKYLIASEAGASVYSASKLARKELPELDVSMRGAVSIARRVQDPLAELVKIDPKSIGVGMYQHDVDQNRLSDTLNGVVESVVNQVGVEVNTASSALLRFVAGIGPQLGKQIVSHRDQNGPFQNRQSLLDVRGMGPKSFEQSAGFLRIREGDNPLDASAIHPESYPIARAVLQMAGLDEHSSLQERTQAITDLQTHQPIESLAAELGTGVPTLLDIFDQLIKPGRDPRENLPKPILRSDVLTMDDLTPGLQLKGTIRNIVDFGAFIDIGVKHDGLLHRSEIPPGIALRVGDVLNVVIKKVEPHRERIGLGWSKS